MNKRRIPRLTRYVPLLLALLLCTCGPAHDHGTDEHDHADEHHDEPAAAHGDEHGHSDGHGDEHGHEAGTVHLTRQQIENVDITFGAFTELKINDFLSATGTLGLPPNAYAAVSAPAAGFLRNTRNYVEGDYVRRGAVIGVLENPEFIEHQREYLEASAKLTFERQELERQETLLAADAGILKAVQRMRAEVAVLEARVAGLAGRLDYLGIKVATLTPDKITQRITVFAARGGYITHIALNEGMYVEPSTELMEVIDEDHLHLELDIFERDIARVRKGQRITYRIPALGDRRYTGEIHVIGKEFNGDNKTVRVHAHPTGEQPSFIRDLFLEARIWLSDETVTALPEAAVLRDGELSYIYVAPPETDGGEVEFRRIAVNPGGTDGGYTAVRLLEPLPPDARVVVSGAFFISAQGMVGELEHDH